MPGLDSRVPAMARDNLEEFIDPVNYDLEEAPGSARRIEFYVALATRIGGAVLDLACGTGLVALPVAERGLRVTGVDLAKPMLDHARSKAHRGHLDVDWVEGDARDFDLDRRFALVLMTGHAFQAFLTRDDQDRVLACVKRHLAEDGVFAFDNRNPSGHDLRSRAAEEEWQTYTDAAGHRVAISGTQDFDAAAQTMRWTAWRRWNDGGRRVERTSRIACRFMDANDQNALLWDHGFEVAEQFGDWGRGPLTARSEEIISICRLESAAPR
jgi:SAM-dependent methyltransferase